MDLFVALSWPSILQFNRNDRDHTFDTDKHQIQNSLHTVRAARAFVPRGAFAKRYSMCNVDLTVSHIQTREAVRLRAV